MLKPLIKKAIRATPYIAAAMMSATPEAGGSKTARVTGMVSAKANGTCVALYARNHAARLCVSPKV